MINQAPLPDPNDPGHWPSLSQNYSTSHPYSNNDEEVIEVSVPGADKVAVHFSRFETEKGFDKVLFFDKMGNKLGEMTGNETGSLSPVATGDTLLIHLQSDHSITDYGFDIDKVHYLGIPRDSWQVVNDPVSTPHPYSNRIDQEVVFEQPGASEIRVQFGRFETEKRYDFVYFYDSEGKELAKWDGDHSGEFSPTAQGERLIIRIQTDFSVTRYGFDIESMHYR